MKNAIQVAWVIDQAEADMLMSNWVEYLWFPLRLTVWKEDLSEEYAAEIAKTITWFHKPVIITYEDTAEKVLNFCEKMWIFVIQLHWKISLEEVKKIKESNPDIYIIKSLVVSGENTDELIQMVRELSEYVDAFITDTFDPKTWAEWATWKTHDWSISKKLVEISPKPVIIAWWLNPTNVKDAIIQIRPAWVDAHTWLEWKDWRKDPDKIAKFVQQAKDWFAIIN